MTDVLEILRARAEAEERPLLAAAARAALTAEPGPAALSELARCVGALSGPSDELADDELDAAEALARVGLESGEAELTWDAVHLIGELGLEGFEDELLGLIEDSKQPSSIRARAVEAWAEGADAAQVSERLEELRTQDESWTVRRAAKDSAHRLGKDETLGGDLFGRYEALIRTDRLRTETDEEELNPRRLANMGLRLPAAYQVFLLRCFAGGRLVFLELSSRNDPADAGHFVLTTPRRLLGEVSQRVPSDLANFNEYVYTRYVEGESRYAKVDESYALARYAEHYDRGWIDDEAYNYGVLLFESAYAQEDDAARADFLLRSRDVLRTFKLRTPEEWEAVDDRLLEAEDEVERDQLGWPLRDTPRKPLLIGRWAGVVELALDLEGQGVFARDTDAAGKPWQRVAPCLSAFVNGPSVGGLGEEDARDPLTLLGQAEQAIEAGKRRKAARLFADALEQDHKSKPVLKAVARLLTRKDLEPLDAGQLCAAIMLEGDRTSGDSVKAALQAVPPKRALAMVEALLPYDEAGSQVALFVNAAAALRKRSHAEVKDAAKRSREGRGKVHNRTMRNPWYK
ncbi:MAG TPA: hypothetical protein DEA08_27295 [Planctomycetes bacterium]|nr:hypothetical protein [Planctomycetota bacterium]